MDNTKNNTRHWYALYTRPRFEKRIERVLKDLRLETFLPLRVETRKWSDRKKIVHEPLFPSYLFIYANGRERHVAFQATGVVRFVSFNGEPAIIAEDQIKAVKLMLDAGYAPVPYPYPILGDQVEIVSGPLTGLIGCLIESRNKRHFVISLDDISQSIAVNIDARSVRLISQSRNTLEAARA